MDNFYRIYCNKYFEDYLFPFSTTTSLFEGMFKIVNMGGNFWSDHSLFQSKFITIFQYYRHFNNTFYI